MNIWIISSPVSLFIFDSILRARAVSHDCCLKWCSWVLLKLKSGMPWKTGFIEWLPAFLPSLDLCLLATLSLYQGEPLLGWRRPCHGLLPHLGLLDVMICRNWEIRSRFLWDSVSRLIPQVLFRSPFLSARVLSEVRHRLVPNILGWGGYKFPDWLSGLMFWMAIGSSKYSPFRSKLCQDFPWPPCPPSRATNNHEKKKKNGILRFQISVITKTHLHLWLHPQTFYWRI